MVPNFWATVLTVLTRKYQLICR